MYQHRTHVVKSFNHWLQCVLNKHSRLHQWLCDSHPGRPEELATFGHWLILSSKVAISYDQRGSRRIAMGLSVTDHREGLVRLVMTLVAVGLPVSSFALRFSYCTIVGRH